MSKRFLAAALVAALASLGGWALAQPAQQGQPGLPGVPGDGPLAGDPVVPPGVGIPAQPGGRRLPAAAPGRYAVVRLDKGALLVDTATGKTWDLRRDPDGRAAWVPARRLDSEKDVGSWLKEREAGRAAAQDRQEELRRDLEKVRHDVRLQEEQARRALEEARRRLEELQRAKDRQDPK